MNIACNHSMVRATVQQKEDPSVRAYFQLKDKYTVADFYWHILWVLTKHLFFHSLYIDVLGMCLICLIFFEETVRPNVEKHTGEGSVG